MNINWKDCIYADPEILVGRPVVWGTRLSVEFILGLFAQGWSEAQVLENNPDLTREQIQAVFAYAASCMRDDIQKQNGCA